ncbi:dihydropteroate synthase [Prevotella loescheii]|nr:dihydropteroate synthase [Hoylesella loescheii]
MYFDYKLTLRDNMPWHISRPQVMGILNCTPDSFYAGSRKQTDYDIASRAEDIIADGGTVIDVGGMSTRPGGDFVTEEEELRRLRHALSIVRKEQPEAILSVDTFRPTAARMAVEEFGADIINDVSEGGVTSLEGVRYDEGGDIFHEVARLKAAYVLMSVQPTASQTIDVLREKVKALREIGVENIIVDPGYGFGKDIRENYRLMGRQGKICRMLPECPLLAGVSRKRMIWQMLGITADNALNGTTAVNTMALMNGAAILRVHDVKEAVEAVRIYEEYSSSIE